jgi:hypothetical protein
MSSFPTCMSCLSGVFLTVIEFPYDLSFEDSIRCSINVGGQRVVFPWRYHVTMFCLLTLSFVHVVDHLSLPLL